MCSNPRTSNLPNRMATPSQKIRGMKTEIKMLKRSLMAVSGCSTPAPSDDTVLTLCNRSRPLSSEPKPETCDAACQYEELEGAVKDRDADFKIANHCDSLNASAAPRSPTCADSPASDTPLRTIHKPCVNSTPLIDFSIPRAIRRTILTPGRCSEASWLDSEKTPNILPVIVRDVQVQVSLPEGKLVNVTLC